MEDPRFDGLFMSAIQQSQGIDNFFNNLFSFMRRKTDFFSQDENSAKVVMKHMEAHHALFKQDTDKQKLIEEKKREMAQKAAPKVVQKPKVEESGATIEEIDDDEAKKIEALQQLKKQQADARAMFEADKAAGKKEKTEEEKKAEDALKQEPNAGNGGQTETYIWHQTLEEVSVFIPLPAGTKANMLDVKIGIKDFKYGLKGKEPLITG
jgi:hypothetical protein